MDDAQQNARPWARSVGFAGLGIGVLVGLILVTGRGEVLDALLGAHMGLFAAAFAVFCLQIPLLALRWWWVLRLLDVPTRFSDILAAHCGAAVTNFVVPGHVGEAVLSAWLERTGRAPGVEAFTALVACKCLTLLISLAMLAAGLLGTDAEALRPWRAPALIALGSAVAAGLLALQLEGRSDADATGFARLVQRARATVQDLRRRPAALAAGTVLTMLNAVALCVVLGLVYAACGAGLSPVDTVLLRAVDTLGHAFAGWIPGNLGVDEVVLTVTSHHGLGVTGPLAVGSALLHKGIVFGYVLLAGGIFAAIGRRR